MEFFSFKMDQFIALGSYGKVYSGTYEGQQVAIKKIDLDRLRLDGNEDRECQVLRQLDHPNVLKLLHWEDKGEFRFKLFLF